MSTYFPFSYRDATAVSQHTKVYKSFYLCLLINLSKYINIYVFIYVSHITLSLNYSTYPFASIYLSINLSIHLLLKAMVRHYRWGIIGVWIGTTSFQYFRMMIFGLRLHHLLKTSTDRWWQMIMISIVIIMSYDNNNNNNHKWWYKL